MVSCRALEVADEAAYNVRAFEFIALKGINQVA